MIDQSPASRKPWFVTDVPIGETGQDEFRHRDVTELLRNIVEADDPPGVVGLIGPFGTGKSSVGELLVRSLAEEQRGPRRAVRLSADKHTGIERQRALLYDLAEALVDQGLLTEHRRDQALRPITGSIQRITTDWRTLARTFSWVAVMLAGVYILGVAVAVIVHALQSARSAQPSPWAWPVKPPWTSFTLAAGVLTFLLGFVKVTVTNPRQETADELERVFRKLLEGCSKELERLVLVVDDIDRLPPNQALEAITTVRSLKDEYRRRRPQVIFVVACDDRVLQQAIADADASISRVEGSAERGAGQYLEKLFTVRLYMPPHLLTSMRAYARKRVRDVDLSIDVEDENLPGEVPQQNIEDVLQQNIPVLIHHGARTPRDVIRLLNAFAADLRLALKREKRSVIRRGEVTGYPGVLARLTALRVDFPDIYYYLAQEPDLLPVLERVAQEPIDLDHLDPRDRERIEALFRALSSTQEGPREGQPIPSVAGAAEDKLVVPASCAGAMKFLRETAEIITRQPDSLQPFFYLGQEPSEAILGRDAFLAIEQALDKYDADMLHDTYRVVRGDSQAVEAMLGMIADRLEGISPKAQTLRVDVVVQFLSMITAGGLSGERYQALLDRLAGLAAREETPPPRPQTLATLVMMLQGDGQQGRSAEGGVAVEPVARRLLQAADHADPGAETGAAPVAVYQLAISGRLPHELAGDVNGALRRSLYRLADVPEGDVLRTLPAAAEPRVEQEHVALIVQQWLQAVLGHLPSRGNVVAAIEEAVTQGELCALLLAAVHRVPEAYERIPNGFALSRAIRRASPTLSSRDLAMLYSVATRSLEAEDGSLRWCGALVLAQLMPSLTPIQGDQIVEALEVLLHAEEDVYPETKILAANLLQRWRQRQQGRIVVTDELPQSDWTVFGAEHSDELAIRLPISLLAEALSMQQPVEVEDVLDTLQVGGPDPANGDAQPIERRLAPVESVPDYVMVRLFALCIEWIEQDSQDQQEPNTQDIRAIQDVLFWLLHSAAVCNAASWVVEGWRKLLHEGGVSQAKLSSVAAALSRMFVFLPDLAHEVQQVLLEPARPSVEEWMPLADEGPDETSDESSASAFPASAVPPSQSVTLQSALFMLASIIWPKGSEEIVSPEGPEAAASTWAEKDLDRTALDVINEHWRNIGPDERWTLVHAIAASGRPMAAVPQELRERLVGQLWRPSQDTAVEGQTAVDKLAAWLDVSSQRGVFTQMLLFLAACSAEDTGAATCISEAASMALVKFLRQDGTDGSAHAAKLVDLLLETYVRDAYGAVLDALNRAAERGAEVFSARPQDEEGPQYEEWLVEYEGWTQSLDVTLGVLHALNLRFRERAPAVLEQSTADGLRDGLMPALEEGIEGVIDLLELLNVELVAVTSGAGQPAVA